MQGNFSNDALEDALFGFIEEGAIEDFSEYYDFGATCMRPDGSLYGISGGKCRKGNETDKAAPKPKKGRPAGGKNVAKNAPGEAAARMKAAYDKLVGIELSKQPGAVPAAVGPSTKPPSNASLTQLQNLVASLKAKDDELRDRAGNLMSPGSGHIATSDQTRFDNINKQVAQNWSRLNAAERQLNEALAMRALGRPAIPPSEPTNKPALQKKLDDAQNMQRAAGARIDELRPYKDGQYRMPSNAYDQASLERAISMNAKAYDKINEAQRDIRRAEFDKRNTELQKVQAEALGKYKDLQAANKRYEAEVKKAGGPYGEKAAEALENRNRLAKEFGNIRDRYDKLVADKLGAPRAATINKSDGLVTALGKDLSGQRRLVSQLEKEAAKADKARLWAAKNPHQLNEKAARQKWLDAENALSEAKKNLKNLEGAHRLAVSKELSVATRASDRFEVREGKKAAQDLKNAIEKAKALGVPQKDIDILKNELSMQMRDIRNQKLQQSLNAKLSAKEGDLTKQHRKGTEVLQRAKRLAEERMNRLLRQANDLKKTPEERAELRKQFDAVRANRLDLVKEINARYQDLEAARRDRRAKQAEASAKAEQLLAAREASAKGKRDAKLDASINRLQEDVNKKADRIQQLADAQAIARRQINEADRLQREAQERVQKYASMIRNARTPSEKELLQKAFEKRTDLAKQIQDGIAMRDKAELSLAKLQKERVKAVKELNDADVKVAEARKRKKDIEFFGTAASTDTRDAREAVRTESRRVDRAIAEGKAEILNANKSDFNWNVGSGSGSKALSSGSFGSAFVVPGPPRATVKVGQIGNNEAAAMDIAAKAGLAPNVIRAARDMNASERSSYGVTTKLGKMAYEFVEGKPVAGKNYMDVRSSPNVQVRDAIWAARAKLHKSGVAHEDMHIGNVLVNKDGSVKFIDFGLAKIGNKQALAEALGVAYVPGSKGQGTWGRGGDEQMVRWKQFGTGKDGKVPPNLQRILDNRAKVEKAMQDDGFTKGHIDQFMRGDNFRKGDDHYASGGWKHMSDDLATKYVEMLYDGVS